jgi:hypothetical protein
VGSNAIPSNPRSLLSVTGSVNAGVASSEPFLKIRTVPRFNSMKRRPSGENSQAVGSSSEPATSVSVNPGGTCAEAKFDCVRRTRKINKTLYRLKGIIHNYVVLQ